MNVRVSFQRSAQPAREKQIGQMVSETFGGFISGAVEIG